jgi:hypothetical protein
VATLWTYLDDTGRREAARFPDFVKIQGMTADKWNDLHLAHLTFLEQAKADCAPAPASRWSGLRGSLRRAMRCLLPDHRKAPKSSSITSLATRSKSAGPFFM